MAQVGLSQKHEPNLLRQVELRYDIKQLDVLVELLVTMLEQLYPLDVDGQRLKLC